MRLRELHLGARRVRLRRRRFPSHRRLLDASSPRAQRRFQSAQ